jgi:hypothetical protein
MIVGELQTLLARLYRLDVEFDVNDFIVTDRELVRELVDNDVPIADEMLLIREADAAVNGELDVALYLDADMMQRLAATDPNCGWNLQANNLNDFCIALEGISHFVYVAWNAVQDKQVTQLELELQAEIDKYLSTRLLLESQAGSAGSAESAFSANVLPALFDTISYREDLPPDRLERYRQANQFAMRFCHNLQQRYPSSTDSPSMLDELRAFYRLPQQGKFSHMQAAQVS